MATKTITLCDGCEEILRERKDKYYLRLETDSFLDGAGDTDTNEVNLVFCRKCAEDIKSSLSKIANRQKNDGCGVNMHNSLLDY
jgi:hypothetical protein